MARAVALNVGANTNEPGFRGPIWPDGRFTFVPIPESESTTRQPPTYADLGLELPFDLPAATATRPVHLDPEFAGYPHAERYTYGDPWGGQGAAAPRPRGGRLSLLLRHALDRR